MKIITPICLIVLACFAPKLSSGQTNSAVKKGDFYFAWGYSREAFSNSDIHFKGANYDFTLEDVEAHDRQSPFAWNPYFKINQLTIPQYNINAGYFLNDKYAIALGWDHMKYVMDLYQTVKISGEIDLLKSPYNKVYQNEDILITPEFLTFEHTDGLNYANVELRRFDCLLNRNKVNINAISGLGIGVLYPRTNASVLDMERADQWHLSGYGTAAVAGINATFFDHYFLQTELKGGYINMQDIVTTYDDADRASQDFFFGQWNVTFGARFNVLKK